eukprot:m51a1_g4749 hypothetical protein (203) ;mRNA; f:399589-400464
MAGADEFWPRQIELLEEEAASEAGLGGAGQRRARQPIPDGSVRRLMKSEPTFARNGSRVGADAQALVARLAEALVADLARRAWRNAANSFRTTVKARRIASCHMEDVSAAAASSDQFDFLVDTVPRACRGVPASRHRQAIDAVVRDILASSREGAHRAIVPESSAAAADGDRGGARPAGAPIEMTSLQQSALLSFIAPQNPL